MQVLGILVECPMFRKVDQGSIVKKTKAWCDINLPQRLCEVHSSDTETDKTILGREMISRYIHCGSPVVFSGVDMCGYELNGSFPRNPNQVQNQASSDLLVSNCCLHTIRIYMLLGQTTCLNTIDADLLW